MGLVNHLMISHTWNIKGGESKHTFELLSLTVDRNTEIFLSHPCARFMVISQNPRFQLTHLSVSLAQGPSD